MVFKSAANSNLIVQTSILESEARSGKYIAGLVLVSLLLVFLLLVVSCTSINSYHTYSVKVEENTV